MKTVTQIIEAFLNNEFAERDNMTAYTCSNGSAGWTPAHITLYASQIAKRDEFGKIWIQVPRGFNTMTTRKTLNKFPGLVITSRKGVLGISQKENPRLESPMREGEWFELGYYNKDTNRWSLTHE